MVTALLILIGVGLFSAVLPALARYIISKLDDFLSRVDKEYDILKANKEEIK